VSKLCILGFKKGKNSQKEEKEDGDYEGLKKMKTQMNKKRTQRLGQKLKRSNVLKFTRGSS